MDDKAQRVHDVAVEHDIELDELALAVLLEVIIKGSIPTGTALERIKKVINDLSERQLIVDIDTIRIDVIHPDEGAAPILTQLHDVADIIRRGVDMRVCDRFLRQGDQRRIGEIGGVTDHMHRAVGQRNAIVDGGRCRDKVEVILALQSLLDDLHVQESEEAAAIAEAQCHRGLGLKGEGRVI